MALGCSPQRLGLFLTDVYRKGCCLALVDNDFYLVSDTDILNKESLVHVMLRINNDMLDRRNKDFLNFEQPSIDYWANWLSHTYTIGPVFLFS